MARLVIIVLWNTAYKFLGFLPSDARRKARDQREIGLHVYKAGVQVAIVQRAHEKSQSFGKKNARHSDPSVIPDNTCDYYGLGARLLESRICERMFGVEKVSGGAVLVIMQT